MDPYILVLACFGVLVLLTAWLPMVLKELPLSLPIFCVMLGIAVFSFPTAGLAPLPSEYPQATERITEFVVIIALMGAGLKLDRPLSFASWALTWRLLAIVMPLSIVGIAFLGWTLGLSAAAALLLGAVLAPTDPVLASDVQVGPPGSGEEDEVRFSLTSEAGLNDGLAFPFTNLAIAITLAGTAAPGAWTLEWFGIDVLWKTGAGIFIGWAVGRLLGYLTFRLPNRAKLSRTGDGFVALGITCVSYGVTEMLHGYGFLAVFVAALSMRSVERGHQYHERLHDFAEQTERLLMMMLLVLFGGAIAQGLLAPLTWPAMAAGLAVIFIVRPAASAVALWGCKNPWRERAILGFFGIRGIGSFYYLAYAGNHAGFQDLEYLWALVSFIVLVSIFLHGTTVTLAMRFLDRHRSGTRAAAGLGSRVA